MTGSMNGKRLMLLSLLAMAGDDFLLEPKEKTKPIVHKVPAHKEARFKRRLEKLRAKDVRTQDRRETAIEGGK